MSAEPKGAALRWSGAFQALAHRAAHEIRNPLNSAMINLEVVRGRAGRVDAEAGALVPFVEAAALELARAAELIDALLALARPAPAPVDLAGVLRPLATLYAEVAAGAGGRVTIEHVGAEAAETEVDGDAARLVLAAVLEEATRGTSAVYCAVGRRGEHVVVRVSGGNSGPLPAELRALAAETGIHLEQSSNELTVRFPACRRGIPTSDGIS